MDQILQYLKKHGEKLDSDIAIARHIPLTRVRAFVTELTATGEVIVCHTTRYVEGRKVEGILCRISGYIPPASPGKKAT